MSRVVTTQQNWTGGELSPKLAGRFDLNIYYNGASYLCNFEVKTQGIISYRGGTIFTWGTRDNDLTRLIRFRFNTEQAYALAFSEHCIRIIKNGAILTTTPVTITGITKANPAVVSYSGTDPTNGDRVIITGVVGMTEVNNQEFIVANVNGGANTFELQGIDSSGYTTYVSDGTFAPIVEVTTTYDEDELWDIDFAQINDIMYLTHPDHAPAKLTRVTATSWTLADVTFTSNPFGTTKAATQSITAATQANPCVVTYGGSDTYANGDTVYIDGVVGMTELNKKNYTVQNVNTGANTFELKGVDATDYTTYGSGGTIAEYTAFEYPAKVGFFEQRLIYASTASQLQTLFFSVGADYDNFLYGTGDSDAIKYTLASTETNKIQWMIGTQDFLAIGTSGGEFRAQGGSSGDPITPTNISVTPTAGDGSAPIRPVVLNSRIMYVGRDELSLYSMEFDAIQNGFDSIDRTLAADHIAETGIKELAYQSGRGKKIIWAVRNDGQMIGDTFDPREQVNGWHRHKPAPTLLADGFYESLCTVTQTRAPDALYVVVNRTLASGEKRYIEYFPDQPTVPRQIEYYTGKANKDEDMENFLTAMFESQKRQFYVDCGLTYDGSIYATEALSLSLTTVGLNRTITAAGAIFTSGMVDREIWGKAGGRAIIRSVDSSTVVTVKITVAFPSNTIEEDEWYLTANEFSGFQHLAGEEIVVLADGGVIEGTVVEDDGTFELVNQASYVTAGLLYLGIVAGMNLEGGGDNGTSQTKKKSLSQLGARFLATLGVLFGIDPYKLERVKFRSTKDKTDRPAPLYTGDKVEDIRDDWSEEKRIYFVQDKPQPCNIQLVAPYMTTNDG